LTSEDETLRRLAFELQILENTAEALQSRINLITAAMNELFVANATLEGLEGGMGSASLFVPIGGGSYVKAKLESTDEVIVGVGAGIAIEKTMKEAIENVVNRRAELEKTRMSIQQQLNQVLEKIQDDRSKLQGLMSERERRRAV
jgi:prefoldin alpha subunit